MPRIIGTQFLNNLFNPPKVIFVTAYWEYAIEGFELDAVDYLVKPVSFERFFKAVTKLNRLIGREETLAITNNSVAKPEAFVYLWVNKSIKKILINDIEYIESCKDYVMVYIAGSKFFLVKQSISSMENRLLGHKFMRVHKFYMVSISKVSGYNGL